MQVLGFSFFKILVNPLILIIDPQDGVSSLLLIERESVNIPEPRCGKNCDILWVIFFLLSKAEGRGFPGFVKLKNYQYGGNTSEL